MRFFLSCLILASVAVDALGESRLLELRSLEQFKKQFNRDRGRPRLILLLSPT